MSVYIIIEKGPQASRSAALWGNEKGRPVQDDPSYAVLFDDYAVLKPLKIRSTFLET